MYGLLPENAETILGTQQQQHPPPYVAQRASDKAFSFIVLLSWPPKAATRIGWSPQIVTRSGPHGLFALLHCQNCSGRPICFRSLLWGQWLGDFDFEANPNVKPAFIHTTDPRLCAAIADSLTFNGTIIQTGTDSCRLSHARLHS